MAEYRCYYHHNCEDRPAVAKCYKCGKQLCRECAETLKSQETGKPLCLDCLTEEMTADYARVDRRKKKIAKERRGIIISFLVGIIIAIAMIVTGSVTDYDWSLVIIVFGVLAALWLPSFLASRKIILDKLDDLDLAVFKIIGFIIFMLIAPIMFLVRVIRRSRDIKILKRVMAAQERLAQAKANYARLAGEMNTRLETIEQIRARLQSELEAKHKQELRAIEHLRLTDKDAYAVRESEIKAKYEKEIDTMNAEIAKKDEENKKMDEELKKTSEDLVRSREERELAMGAFEGLERTDDRRSNKKKNKKAA